MKQLFLVLTAFCLSAGAFRAQAVSLPPYLGSLRGEVFNQMTIASNNIAMTNDVAGNKKLLKTLGAAIKLIDRTKPNSYTAGSAALGALARSLGRTSLSNTFNPIVEATLDIYIGSLDSNANNLASRLAAAYPGKIHNAADISLAKLIAAINSADTNVNLTLALKALSLAVRNLGAAEKIVFKAENAPAPLAGITFSVTGAINHSGKTTGAGIAYYPIGVGNFVINGGQGTLNPIGLRSITLALYSVPEGTSTIALNEGQYTYGVSTIPPSGESFSKNTTGSVTVTRNSANKTLFGTFTFQATEQDNAGRSVTVTGSFSGTWL